MQLSCRSLFGVLLLFLLSCNVLASIQNFAGMHRTRKSYSGYKLLRTKPLTNKEHATSLLYLDGLNGVHFWKYPAVNDTTDIFAAPHQIKIIQSLLQKMGLSHDTVFEDAQSLVHDFEIPEQKIMFNESSYFRAGNHPMFQSYQRYNTILNYVKSLAAKNSLVGYQTIGKSTEGRPIVIVRVSKDKGRSKPGVFIDGGMHAREWISPATTMYLLESILNDPKGQELLEMFDFYFVPVINVDGYEYSHTRDRFWRKTRSRQGQCMGVDPNRNWAYHWAETGSSNNPCSDIYHGPRAFSEPETAAVANAIMALRNKLKLYLTLHAYSQLWLIPYAYKNGAKPVDYGELYYLANVGKNGLQETYGTPYKIGTAPDILYASAGGSDDWAKGVAGIKYAYTLELRDQGRFGFALPPSQIVPTGKETFNGISALVKALYYRLSDSERSAGEVGKYHTDLDLAMNRKT